MHKSHAIPRTTSTVMWTLLALMCLTTAFIASTRAAFGFGNCSTICINGKCTSDCGDDGEVIRGSDKLVTRAFDLPPIDRIKADGVMDVNVVQGNVQRVQVTVNDNLADHVDVAESGGELIIRMRPGPFENLNLKANVVMPTLHAVSANGVTDLSFDGFESNSLAIAVDGTSKIKGAQSRAKQVSVAARGNSEVNLKHVVASRAEVDIDGVSQAVLRFPDAGGDLTGYVGGVSRVEYCGHVTRNRVRLDGVSAVEKSVECPR